jgi:type I restriction enzyme S subunit
VLKDADLAGYNCGSTQPLVRQSDIKEIPVISPPKELLADFEGICLPIFNRINFNKRQIASLEKIRDSLLPKLMSGEMRVS